MKLNLLRFSFVLVLLFILIGCTGSTNDETSATDVTPVAEKNVIVLGDISDEPAETIRGTQPIADYLASQLAEYGIESGAVKIAPDFETMTQWIANGEVDMYSDSPYPILVISDETGAEPILRRWKYGVSEYHSVFFARADSDFEELADVVGQMVAFEESFSTSGFMLPLSHLIEQGLNPVEKMAPEESVGADEVGYVFSSNDDNTVQWVISGKVPVGVVDNVTFSRLPEETQNQLVVFAETEDVPRQLVLLQPGLSSELAAAIKTELVEMDENEEGQAALEVFLTSQFDEFPEGAEAALTRMRTLYQLVQDK